MWKKGKSGNPKGRPKVEHSIVVLARNMSEMALDVLADVCRDTKAPHNARVSAATAIIDRGYGRPPQFMTGNVGAFRKASEMTDDELATIAAGGSIDAAGEANGKTELH